MELNGMFRYRAGGEQVCGGAVAAWGAQGAEAGAALWLRRGCFAVKFK